MSFSTLPRLNTGEPIEVNSMVSRSRFSCRKTPSGLAPEWSGRAIRLNPVPCQKPGRSCSGPRFAAVACCDDTARKALRGRPGGPPLPSDSSGPRLVAARLPVTELPLLQHGELLAQRLDRLARNGVGVRLARHRVVLARDPELPPGQPQRVQEGRDGVEDLDQQRPLVPGQDGAEELRPRDPAVPHSPPV